MVDVGIVLIAAGLRLFSLGNRTVTHDEAIDAMFSASAGRGAVIRYDPKFHGPFRFALEGLIVRFAGVDPASMRLLAALCGVATVIVVLRAGDLLGTVGARVAAVALAVSPVAVTVSRTGREDSLIGLFSVLVLVLVARSLRSPNVGRTIALFAIVAASFATKETTFLFLASGGVFFLGLLFGAARRRPRCVAALASIRANRTTTWKFGIAAFALVFTALFTEGFRYPAGLQSGLIDGLRYWWSQHEVRRGGQPWFYYLLLFGAYEWCIVALAAVGLRAARRGPDLTAAWFATMAGTQFVIYSWAGEKFPWLALHPLLPLALLGGVGAEAIFGGSGRPKQRALRSLTALGLGASLFTAVGPAFARTSDPRELMVPVQTAPDVKTIASMIRRLQREGRAKTVVVDDRDGGGLPWFVYLQGIPGVRFSLIDPKNYPLDADVIVVNAPVDIREFRPPDGYEATRFSFRRWWVPDYPKATPSDLARWFFTRRTWNGLGSMDQYVLVRITPPGLG